MPTDGRLSITACLVFIDNTIGIRAVFFMESQRSARTLWIHVTLRCQGG